MTVARAPRVYAADIDGVHEWIVAAPNQRAALEALGVHQDLFAQGLARPERDPAKVEAARERPGVALRRPKGSRREFEPVDADGRAAWSAALKAAPKGAGGRSRKPAGGPAKRPSEAGVSAPDRRPVLEAQKALKAFDREAARTLADLDEERAAVERRAKRTEAAIAGRRKVLQRAVDKAEAAYERARSKV